jgi:hypothetical protein
MAFELSTKMFSHFQKNDPANPVHSICWRCLGKMVESKNIAPRICPSVMLSVFADNVRFPPA